MSVYAVDALIDIKVTDKLSFLIKKQFKRNSNNLIAEQITEVILTAVKDAKTSLINILMIKVSLNSWVREKKGKTTVDTIKKQDIEKFKDNGALGKFISSTIYNALRTLNINKII
jgi:hypothetical protein